MLFTSLSLSVLRKTVPSVLSTACRVVLETLGTDFPNMDLLAGEWHMYNVNVDVTQSALLQQVAVVILTLIAVFILDMHASMLSRGSYWVRWTHDAVHIQGLICNPVWCNCHVHLFN